MTFTGEMSQSLRDKINTGKRRIRYSIMPGKRAFPFLVWKLKIVPCGFSVWPLSGFFFDKLNQFFHFKAKYMLIYDLHESNSLAIV